MKPPCHIHHPLHPVHCALVAKFQSEGLDDSDAESAADCAPLCEVPEIFFEWGGPIQTMLADAGYDERAEKVIGDWGAWNWTLGLFSRNVARYAENHNPVH